MGKDYDENKSRRGGRKWFDILFVSLRALVVIGCILVALAFVIMLLFPSYNGLKGWTNFFNPNPLKP